MIPEQQTPEWHDLRRKSIGASDVPKILGVSEFMTPYQLWEEKLGFSKQKQTESMRIGLEIEDEARDWFFDQTGIQVKPKVLMHPNADWAHCSLDGISESGKTIVEIKRVKKEYHEKALRGEIPLEYSAQVQWQMWVTGLDEAFYLSYNKENPVLLTIHRDEKFIIYMIEKAKEFHRWVSDLIPPPLTDRDYIDVSYNVTLSDKIERYKQYYRFHKNYEFKAAELKEEIIRDCEGKNIKCENFKMSKIVSKGRVDYEQIVSHLDIDLEKYRKPSITSYRMSFE